MIYVASVSQLEISSFLRPVFKAKIQELRASFSHANIIKRKISGSLLKKTFKEKFYFL